MKRSLAAAALATGLWSACAPLPEPAALPVAGAEEDLSVLVGDWWGEYSSVDTGRDGRIRFSLAAATSHEARGDVLMFPSPRDGEIEAAPGSGGEIARSFGGRKLTIRFVRANPGEETITGTLEPYEDPDCRCLVTTTFVGRVSRDRIEGTYETRGGPEYRPTRGRWWVDRRSEDDDRPPAAGAGDRG